MEQTILRRAPVQERSAARLERMLDACSSLIQEVGYDATTTTLIARRAGVSVGSLYQFFPDKRAIARALSRRNLETFLTRMRAIVLERGLSGSQEVVDAAVDLYVELHRTDPRFRAVRFGDVLDEYGPLSEKDGETVLTEWVTELLAREFDVPVDDRVRLTLHIAVRLADSVLSLAFSHDADGNDYVTQEAKRITRLYLADRLEPQLVPA